MNKLNRLLIALAGLLGLGLCSCRGSLRDLEVEQFAQLLKEDNVQLLDVRTPDEFSQVRIPGSINIDIFAPDFMTLASRALDKQKTIAIYCRSGRRSMDAAKKLRKAGYTVANLRGGITAWSAQGMPCEKEE